jgi:hypothetical protein
MRTGLWFLLASCWISGCLTNNINPSQKLNERVQEYSDATRWNRMDLAVQIVMPSYRDAFMRSHSAWGRTVEVADSEVIHIQIAPDGNTATSTLAYSWYDLSAMTLARTVVRQQWDIRDGYHVTGEEIVEGAPELLPVPHAADETEADAPVADEVASVQ